MDEVRGRLARAAGRDDTAREHIRHAADGFEAHGQPLDAARCAALAGER